MLPASVKDPLDAWLQSQGFKTRDYACQPLKQGLTNRNWRVTVEDRSWVVRQLSPQSAALGVDRWREARVLAHVTALDLAPTQCLFDVDSGLAISCHVANNGWHAGALNDSRARQRLLDCLTPLHQSPLPGTTLDLGAQAAHYLRQLPPSLHQRAGFERHMATVFKRLADPVPAVLVHHDLNPENILDTGGRVWLIDWEYAANGDPVFDLACLIRSHRVEPATAGQLVREWLQQSRYPVSLTQAQERLALQLQVCDWLSWLWGHVQRGGDSKVQPGTLAWINRAEKALLQAMKG